MLVDLRKNFSPDTLGLKSELGNPKTSLFMHGLSQSFLYMIKQRDFNDTLEMDF